MGVNVSGHELCCPRGGQNNFQESFLSATLSLVSDADFRLAVL